MLGVSGACCHLCNKMEFLWQNGVSMTRFSYFASKYCAAIELKIFLLRGCPLCWMLMDFYRKRIDCSISKMKAATTENYP